MVLSNEGNGRRTGTLIWFNLDGVVVSFLEITSIHKKHNDMNRFFRDFSPWILLIPFLCVAFVQALICSCSRVPYETIQENYESNINDNILYNSTQIDSLFAFLRESENRTNEKLSEITVNSNTIYWSAPDSSGMQYREKENTTVINNKERDYSSLERTTEGYYQQLLTRIDSLAEEIRMQKSIKKESVPRLTRWQQWKQEIGGWITFIIIITLLFVVGKRVYRLIK